MIAKSVQSTRNGYRMRLLRSSTPQSNASENCLEYFNTKQFLFTTGLPFDWRVYFCTQTRSETWVSIKLFFFAWLKNAWVSFLGCVLHNLERFPVFFFCCCCCFCCAYAFARFKMKARANGKSKFKFLRKCMLIFKDTQ